MSAVEDAARIVLAESKAEVQAAGGDITDPNLHLSLMAGMLLGYADRVQRTMKMFPREEAQEVINAMYVFLGDYETAQLTRERDDD